MAGIYIHIPFCASFCRYCSFYSECCTDAASLERYVDALLNEVRFASHFEGRKQHFDPYLPSSSGEASPEVRLQVQSPHLWEQNTPKTRLQVQSPDLWEHPTLYIGGGTPSLLPPEQLERIVSAVTGICSQTGTPFEEFTLEANPDDITPEKLAAWRRLGVNRLSIGVQSFCDAHLRWMCRRHTASQAENAVRMAREAGFDNLSLDLIFGFAGLSDDDWLATIDRALALHPEHLSCYQMSVEEGSPLGDEAAAGAYAPPAQETCARQYALLQQRAAAAGYLQYEISNFALPGREARHNSAYWRREPYWGFGPGAHSYDGYRTRCWNRPDLAAYLAKYSTQSFIFETENTASGVGQSASEAHILDFETLSDKDLANEKVMLSLRTAAGLDLDDLSPEHLSAIRPKLDSMLADGRLVQTNNGLRILADRFFVSDAIIADLFL